VDARGYCVLGENRDQLASLIPLAKASQKRITENFRVATFYNVIAVPVAIAGFATPLIAALAMSLSSISVTVNVFYQELGIKTQNLTR
jgi:Cu2+-exporting ATPase